jgi:hypothetical protein
MLAAGGLLHWPLMIYLAREARLWLLKEMAGNPGKK